ncbi:MAG: hypothetical protein ACYTAF_10425 [Planctomycetota bacterium]
MKKLFGFLAIAAVAFTLVAAVGCNGRCSSSSGEGEEAKACAVDCTKPCCAKKDAPKGCPPGCEEPCKDCKPDCAEPCCAKKDAPKACPADCAKPCCVEGEVGFVNEKCPIMGGAPVADQVREFNGKKVGFCCPGCPEAWDKLSDKEKEAALSKVK